MNVIITVEEEFKRQAKKLAKNVTDEYIKWLVEQHQAQR